MNEQAGDITSFSAEKKTPLDYLLLVGGWLVSCISLVIIGLIVYWAIKIPEKNVNNLPIINAIKGDIRIEPINPGGKSFDDKDLSIYKNLDNGPRLPEKSQITLNKADQNTENLRKELKINENGKSNKKDLTLAIEDALKEVVSNVEENEQLETTNVQGLPKLYLGTFDSFPEADEFKKFLKKRNNEFLKANDLKIFEKFEGDKKLFRVQLINISSKEEGEELCSILSSRQFSCLLFNE